MGRHRSVVDADAPLNDGSPGGGSDTSLGRSAAHGTLWLAAQRWIVRVSGLVTIAILTRALTPEEFGVVAAASAVIPFVLLLSELGLSVFIVQAPQVTQRMLSTGFWLCVSVAIVLSGGLVMLAPSIAIMLGVPAAAPVLQTLSASVVVVVLASVPTALLRRRMAFRLLAIQGWIGTVIAQAVAIVLALNGAGAWALVFQVLVSQTIGLTLAWAASGWLPSWHFSWATVVQMVKFGVSIVLVECVSTARAAAESAVVAIVLGPVALGYLAIAQRLVAVIQDMGAAAVVPVSTVVFAKLKDGGARLRGAYLRSISIAYTTVAPLLGFVAVGAPVLIPTFFGNGWDASIPVAQGLALAAVLTLGAAIDQGLFYGVGRPGLWLSYALVIDALTFGVTAIAAHHGLVAVAFGFVLVAFTATVMRWFIIGRLVDAPAFRVAMPLFQSLGPTLVSVACGWIALAGTQGLHPAVALVASVAVVGIVHLLMVRLLEPRVLYDIMTLMPIPARIRDLVETSLRLVGHHERLPIRPEVAP